MTVIKKIFCETKILLSELPPLTFTFFIISLFSMNLFANKSISLPFDWLALDCGILISWVMFLTMDVLTRHFGPKAATIVSLTATGINLILCFVFFICSIIPGVWGESFITGSEDIINSALNHTFGGTWFVILGSSVSFAVAAIVNNFSNYFAGKIVFRKHPDSLRAFALRSYISTALGQFTDNLVFALLVSHTFFGWSLIQCIMSAVLGMAAEFVFQIIFTPIGYRVSEKWKLRKVGAKYFEYKLNGGFEE